MLCLHCVGEFEWRDGMEDETCPSCVASGHTPGDNQKCELCWIAYVSAIDAIKARIDVRVDAAIDSLYS